MSTYKHITKTERETIEEMLDQAASLRSIAKTLDRHCYTISKEIHRHIQFVKSGCHGLPFNDCLNRRDCSNKMICGDPQCSTVQCSTMQCRDKLCRYCQRCGRYCRDYVKETCIRLTFPPYVCNGCQERGHCTLEKQMYFAGYAQKEYEQTKREASSGIALNKEELRQLDEFISPLIKKGQSIQHIMSNNPSAFSLSSKTIYHYIDAGLLSVRNIDLPRKVRYRAGKKSRIPINWSYQIGRKYDDFIQYRKNNPRYSLVQLDSVIGTKGGKVLLTIHFVESQFMLAYLRERNTAASVTQIFESLYQLLEPDTFRKLFPILLTDNGMEFSDPVALEQDPQHQIRTRVFYCRALAPYQKGAAENNHEFIRRILPKGTSFNHLSQEHIDLMMSHINSYTRTALGGKSPYDIFRRIHGQHILDLLNMSAIPPNEIILRPQLLPQKK